RELRRQRKGAFLRDRAGRPRAVHVRLGFSPRNIARQLHGGDRRNRRARRPALAILIAAALFAAGAPAAALDKIKFPYSPISYHSLPFLVAYEAKLFERRGLEVDPIFAGASSLIVQSMLAGEADLAGMAGPAVISNVLKGGDVIQVAALVKSFSVPLYVQPAITQIVQLSGKRVGVTRFGSVSHFTAKAILERSNVTDAVIVQTGGYPESMTALSTNAIAGAMI